MAEARSLLITGATGKQGGAVITALLANPTQPFHIYALTRNKTSNGAQALAKKPNVSIVEGDMKDSAAIFSQVPKPWGVYSVQVPLPSAAAEEEQGLALTAAAVDAGVKHIVYTSVERGGVERSNTNPTTVTHFHSKLNIENDIIAKAKASAQGMTWTFVRPVAFMDNLSNDFLGKGFISMWRLNGMDRKLQLISVKDVGRIAADAFLNADKAEYKNKALSVAGDEISPNEAAAIFKKETGREIPYTYSFVGSALKWGLKKQLGDMFDWFKNDGFGADVAATRKMHPGMQDFGKWVRETSAFRTQ